MPSALVNAIGEIQADGLASRNPVEAARLLARCERCPGYAECSEDAAFAAYLADAACWCERWDVEDD